MREKEKSKGESERVNRISFPPFIAFFKRGFVTMGFCASESERIGADMR